MGQAWGTVTLAGGLVVCCAGVAVGGCYRSHGPAEDSSPRDAEPGMFDGGPDAGRDGGRDGGSPPLPRDGGPPVDAGPPRPLPCEDPQGVDLLLVLDDSGSLQARDPHIRDRLWRMLYHLVRPQDLDGDGWEDWARLTDLHFGVVTTSAHGPPFCNWTRDGALLRGAGDPLGSCSAESYGPIQMYRDGETPAFRFALDATCLAFGPRDGCQAEQPLEAMAKALLPRDAPFAYPFGAPRGDAENAGFLREDSVLVVLMITDDEPDCSVRDPSIFDARDAGPDASALPPLGCTGAPPSAFHPPERYVDALRWLRAGHPERVVFAFLRSGLPRVVRDVEAELGDSPWSRDRIVQVALGLEGRSVAGGLALGEVDLVHAISDRIAEAACGD